MSVVDVDKLVSGLAADAPAGADVEFDPAYFSLEKLARGTPESVMGSEVKPAEEPDWKAVRQAALDLFARTRDLRVAMILATALLKEDGVVGFRDGVAVVKGFIEQLWEQFYPKLDPDDNNDPTIRVNILKGFDGDGSAADLYKFKQRLREATLTRSQQRIGKFGLRDIQIARGEIAPPPAKEGQESKPPDLSIINAAFEDTATEYLLDEQMALQGTIDDLSALDAALAEKAGPGIGPDLTGIKDVLSMLKRELDDQLARRGIGETSPAQQQAASPADGSADVGGERSGAALTGEIASRDDVVRVLDKICDYYARFEPASPVPIFMRRARRLVTMNFVDVIRELAPEAMQKIEIYAGAADGSAGSGT
jgi:type VI secretion system protein ImpA